MVMFIVQPAAKAEMVCSHTMPSGHMSMNIDTENHDHQHMVASEKHSQMSMYGDMDCCKTDCSCPTNMCAPFSLYVGGASLLYNRNGFAEQSFPCSSGTPQSTISSVYKPPILA
ncbi:hypothetical protein J8M20_21605 [Pseudoalteromonas luteoviolacea]|uniref:hypothetical protein n=1 Tax=Pseudoalteromonas luteoviolacea TaxID=43657 RepID=UPI001B38103E|nr:hypothetical protein [Pseudoalteromonas luteoviolacea]MBQ4813977.1 hypothetical protein [Pseudoalteromonas luteoviolacea]